MLKLQTIAISVSNLTDARYFAAMGVEWMDFSLDPANNDQISLEALAGIKDWVEGPKFMVSFGLNVTAEQIISASKEFSLDGVKISNFFPVEDLPNLESLTVIQELVIDENPAMDLQEETNNRKASVAGFLLDYSKSGMTWNDLKTGTANMSLEQLIALSSECELMLKLAKVTPADVTDIHERMPKAILALQGGAEEKVGFKSFDELDEIFEVLEEF